MGALSYQTLTTIPEKGSDKPSVASSVSYETAAELKIKHDNHHQFGTARCSQIITRLYCL